MGLCSSSIAEDPKGVKPLDCEKKNYYKKKTIPKSLKKLVWDTWIGENLGITKCLCCKHQDIRQIEFHCGHVISEKFGGYTSVENLRPICAQCNLSMGSMNMKTFQAQFFLEKLK